MKHGELHGDDMHTWLERERAECTCEEHPKLLDPDCTFCGNSTDEAHYEGMFNVVVETNLL